MKTKKLKLYLGASFLAFFASFFLLSCVGCGGVKKSDNPRDGNSSEKTIAKIENPRVENDKIPSEKQSTLDVPSFEKTIHGKKIKVSLTGNFHKIIEFPNKEYPLEIKEVYPGIVTYDKYDSIKIIPYHQEDSIWIINRVKDKIEFYENGNFLKSYDIDQNNPYLNSRNGIKIMNHYSDAEGTDVLLDKTDRKKYTIDTYHLRQDLSNHESYTSINYWKNEISDGWIVNSVTTIVVIDSIGNIIFSEKYDNKMSPPAISPDGKYLMAAFSGEETVNNAGVKSQSDGFELWQTKPKNILHKEENNDPDMWVSSPNYSSISKALGISYTHPNSKTRMTSSYIFYPSTLEFKSYIKDKLWYSEQSKFFSQNRRYRTWEEIKSSLNFVNVNLNYGK